MKRKIYLIFFMLVFTVQLTYAKCKNLYILIEPTSAMNIEDSSKHILTPSLMTTKSILSWIAKSKQRPKFNNIFIRVVGYRTELYKRKDIGSMPKKPIIRNIYKNIKNKKGYSIANSLSHFSQDLEGLNWKGDETMLLVVGDVDFVENGISSHGRYLNSAWLNNDTSPFVRKFINRDNDISKRSSVVIFTRTQLKLKDEEKRKNFLVNLFSKANMKVYYVGGFYNNFMATLRDSDTYIIKLIDRVRLGKHKHIVAPKMLETNICQIVGEKTMTMKNCGR